MGKYKRVLVTEADLLLDNSAIVSVEEYGKESKILYHKIKAAGVKNIAVMASLGAGKSSAIETYLHTYRPDKKRKILRPKTKPNSTYTRISLASFNDTEYKDSDVERSILQQLLYSQPKNKLPNSKIERTTVTPKMWTMLLSLTMLTFIASTFLFGLQLGKVFLYENILLNWVFLCLAGVSLFILIWTLLYHKKLSRIKYKDFELDVVQKGDIRTHSEQSLINKFVDEVLYFFEATKIDLVIFEDLDRLEYKKDELVNTDNDLPRLNTTIVDRSSAILVKLRELNTLINNSQQCKRKVTFIYAIKDDVIKKQEERTKFFEFILPIVPVLNPVTKEIKMCEIHEEMVKKELGIRDEDKLDHEQLNNSNLKLDSEFISAISTYIPNMRTLKNAFNEYIISHNRIFRGAVKGRLQNENLFAISLYKNLYPYDYAKLEQESGIIPIVMNKIHLIKDEIDASNEKIKKLKELLDKADKEHLDSFTELLLIFKVRVPGITNIDLNGERIQVDSLKTFQGIVLGETECVRNGYHVTIPSNTSLPNGDSFLDREKLLLYKTKECKEQIASLIEKEKQNIIKYESMTFHELIKERGIDFHFKAIEEKESTKAYLAELRNVAVDKEEDNSLKTFNKDSKQFGYLRFLIQNNYLDEKYIEYTSGYESKMLSSFDEDFIRKVQQGEMDFNHKIDNPVNVINQIREINFSEPAILNNTILANLKIIKSQTKNNKLQNILMLLNKEIAYEAIRTYIQGNDQSKITEFLKFLIIGNTGICGKLIRDNQLVKEKKEIVILTLIENTTDYKAHNIERSLTTFLEETEKYEVLLKKVEFDKVKMFLSLIEPRFGILRSEDNRITNYAIENNLYQISIDNLEKVFGITEDNNDFYKKNYEYISNKTKVKDYIEANVNEYVNNVFASDSNSRVANCEEKSDIVVDILNREGLTVANQCQIIKKYTFIIGNIQEYSTDLHACLLEYNRVHPTWANILFAYYKNNGINEIIKNFILRHANDIEEKYECITQENGNEEMLQEETHKNFFIDLVNAKYTSDEFLKLEKIASLIPSYYELSEDYINDESLSIFIASGRIVYKKDDFGYLFDKSKSQQQYVAFYDKQVSNDFDEFFVGIDAHALKSLILYDRISIDLKQKLITEYGGKVTAVSGFEKQYYSVIVNNNLKIPVVLLMRFKDCANLTKDEKLNLAALSSDKEEHTALPLFRSYMESVFPDLENASKMFKIDPTVHQREIFSLYAKASGRKLTKNRDGKITINKTS